jgi:hypothetical protein
LAEPTGTNEERRWIVGAFTRPAEA